MPESNDTTEAAEIRRNAVTVHQALLTLLRHLVREIAKELRAHRHEGPPNQEHAPS